MQYRPRTHTTTAMIPTLALKASRVNFLAMLACAASVPFASCISPADPETQEQSQPLLEGPSTETVSEGKRSKEQEADSASPEEVTPESLGDPAKDTRVAALLVEPSGVVTPDGLEASKEDFAAAVRGMPLKSRFAAKRYRREYERDKVKAADHGVTVDEYRNQRELPGSLVVQQESAAELHGVSIVEYRDRKAELDPQAAQRLKEREQAQIERERLESAPLTFDTLRSWKPNGASSGKGLEILIKGHITQEKLVQLVRHEAQGHDPVNIRVFSTRAAYNAELNETYGRPYSQGYILFYVKNSTGKGAYRGRNEIRWMQEIGGLSRLFGTVTEL